MTDKDPRQVCLQSSIRARIAMSQLSLTPSNEAVWGITGSASCGGLAATLMKACLELAGLATAGSGGGYR